MVILLSLLLPAGWNYRELSALTSEGTAPLHLNSLKNILFLVLTSLWFIGNNLLCWGFAWVFIAHLTVTSSLNLSSLGNIVTSSAWLKLLYSEPRIQDRLRCIRPPQRQSGPNNFLRISACADGSQHLYETNRINNVCTKSLRNFV